jgi:tRNA1(Val) A37 N6-methylase TrmN6
VSAEDSESFDEKGFLGGRLVLRQLRLGHRVGTDAALVIAAARPDAKGRVADIGAGSGAIGLSLAVLNPALEVTLIELDADIAALAAENAALNNCTQRVRSLAVDVEEIAHSAPARRELATPYDLVVTNPPFTNARASQPSPDRRRALAHVAKEGALARWIDATHFLLRPKGVLIAIFRPDALAEMLAALRPKFSEVALRPVHGHAEGAAARILIRARKGGRTPLTVLPPLVLHERDGSFTPVATAIHRGEVEIDFLPRRTCTET